MSADAADRAAGLLAAAPDRPDVFARVSARRLDAATPADRKAMETALAELGNDSPVVERAIASGAPLDAVAVLAAAWGTLDSPARALMRNPLTRHDAGPVDWGRAVATQVSPTTCGAASMAMMLMMGDPLVAMWVAAGRQGGVYVPPEVLAVEVRGAALHTVADRWDALQLSLHDAVTRHGLGPFPWPQAYGTPPWRVDNVVRCARLRFRGVLVDDARADEVSALVSHARAALADGVPVPLYVSGDSDRGLEGVVPRHVVLLVGVDGEDFLIYEPSSGAVHRHRFVVGGGKAAALGNWNRVAWAVLPRVKGR